MRRSLRLISTMLMILAMAGTAGSATTTPATTAAAVSASPKDALIDLAKAMEAADVAALRRVLLAENDSEKALLEQLLALAAAQKDVREAAKARFGAQAGDLTAAPKASDMISAIEAGEETPGGNEATVRTASGVIVVKRIEGQWKVPMSNVIRGASADYDKRLIDVKRMVAIFHQGAADIKSGKYRSADDAADGLRMKLRAAATQPAPTSAATDAAGGSATHK